MAIKPYVSGSVPEQIDVGVVGDDGLSTPLNVTIKADAGTQHADAYTPEIAVKSGEPDYRDRFRGSLAEGVWSEWGVLPTIQPVTEAGTVMAIQGRWLSGDPATVRAAQLVLPQTGITIVEGGELPPIVDTGEGTDSGTVDAVRPLPDATDSGEGTDTAVLDMANDPSLGDITDSGEGADSATIDRVVPVPDVTDSGEGTDVGSLDTAQVLAQVTGFSAGTAADAVANLTWGAVTNAASYTVERCIKATDPGTGSWSGETGYNATTGRTGTSWQVTGLTNGQKYWFRIRAVASGYISGPWSANATVTPVAAATTETWFFDATASGDPEAEPDTLKTTFASSAPSSLQPLIGNGWFTVSAGGATSTGQAPTLSPAVQTHNITPTSSFSSITIQSGTTPAKTVNFGKTYPANTPVEVKMRVFYTPPYFIAGQDSFLVTGSDSKVTVG